MTRFLMVNFTAKFLREHREPNEIGVGKIGNSFTPRALRPYRSERGVYEINVRRKPS